MGTFSKNLLAGLGTGVASGIVDLGTGLISGAFEDKRAEEQHERNKELMELQNRYQLEQWHRENEYNDPSAVASRFRAAGINPRAVLDGSAQGAGIAGGFSSAPSGGAHSPMPYNHLSGLSSSVIAGARVASQIRADEAEAQLKAEKAETESFQQKYILPAEARLREALAKTQKNESVIKNIEAQYRNYLLGLQASVMEGNIQKIYQETEALKQRINLDEASEQKVYKEIDDLSERLTLYAIERSYKRALISVEQNRANNLAMDSALKQAEKGHKEALVRQVDKEIEFIGSKMKMNEAQMALWKKKVNIEIAKLAIDETLATSAEIRKWVYGWIPFTKNDGSQIHINSSDYGDVPMFAD